jgi:hypothetical protein
MARSRNRRIHVRDQAYPARALCGREWIDARGGDVASDTCPPVVRDDESGSVNLANCRVCIDVLRRRLARS